MPSNSSNFNQAVRFKNLLLYLHCFFGIRWSYIVCSLQFFAYNIYKNSIFFLGPNLFSFYNFVNKVINSEWLSNNIVFCRTKVVKTFLKWNRKNAFSNFWGPNFPLLFSSIKIPVKSMIKLYFEDNIRSFILVVFP